MEIVWSALSIESFDSIIAYVESFFGAKTSEKVSDKIASFVFSLARSPHIGCLLHTSELYGELRCAFYKQNHVYYRIVGEQIEIILIWDGRQDPARVQALLIEFLMRE
jgi:plasmid stabilization system protein ParE